MPGIVPPTFQLHMQMPRSRRTESESENELLLSDCKEYQSASEPISPQFSWQSPSVRPIEDCYSPEDTQTSPIWPSNSQNSDQRVAYYHEYYLDRLEQKPALRQRKEVAQDTWRDKRCPRKLRRRSRGVGRLLVRSSSEYDESDRVVVQSTDEQELETSNPGISLLDLPNELLYDILQWVRISSSFVGFQKCLLVNQRVYAVGLPLLYQEVFYSNKQYCRGFLKDADDQAFETGLKGPVLYKQHAAVSIPPSLRPYHRFASHTKSFTLAIDWQLWKTEIKRDRGIFSQTHRLFFSDMPKLLSAMSNLRDLSIIITPQPDGSEPRRVVSQKLRTGVMGIIQALPPTLKSLNIDITALDLGTTPIVDSWGFGVGNGGILLSGKRRGCPFPICRTLTSLAPRLQTLQIRCSHDCQGLHGLGTVRPKCTRKDPTKCPSMKNRHRRIFLGKHDRVLVEYYACDDSCWNDVGVPAWIR
jgi:hypothetical protein